LSVGVASGRCGRKHIDSLRSRAEPQSNARIVGSDPCDPKGERLQHGLALELPRIRSLTGIERRTRRRRRVCVCTCSPASVVS
jgi:hypothetical protein